MRRVGALGRPLSVLVGALVVASVACDGPGERSRTSLARSDATPTATAREGPRDVAGVVLPNARVHPDGTTGWLAFNCAPPPDAAEPPHASDNMCLRSPEGVVSRITSPVLERVAAASNFPTWAPDGRRLLIRLSQPAETGQLDDIGMVDADGRNLVNFTNRPRRGNWGATWSPDGRRIVFNSGARLFVMRADGAHMRKITRFWGEYPAWSPDGKRIAFMSNRCACNGVGGEAEYDLYSIRPDGSGVRRLTSFPGEEGVSGWSSDSRLIAFGRNPDRWPGIWLMTRKGRVVERVRPRADGGINLRGVSQWAPDGSFLMQGIRGDDPQVSNESTYWVSPNGERVLPLGEMTSPSWQPTADEKIVTELSLEHIWLGSGSSRAIRLAGRLTADGAPVPSATVILGRLGSTLPTRPIRSVSTDRDGSFELEIAAPQSENRDWRAATAFYRGSGRRWSTTAFDLLHEGPSS